MGTLACVRVLLLGEYMEKNILNESYRKLKGSVYLDKTIPYLRAEIAEYEANRFEERLEYLFHAINHGTNWDEVERKILSSVSAYTFPKKIMERKTNEGPIVISNIGADTFTIEKYNNFIKMDVEGHILGVLWILLVGYKLDKSLSSNCFGNRLTESLVFENGKTTASPNLFKPYFNQYESWRNQGLSKAREIVNNEGQSVIITMLDLSRYYYNIDFSEAKFWEIISNYNKRNIKVINRISSFVYKVIRRYSECLGEKERNILPIGFLPSNILSNIYLKEFDEKINNLDSTKYYGRYVDDMIVVSQVDNSHELRKSVEHNGIERVSDYMLNLLQTNKIVEEVDESIILYGFSYLSIQKNKLKFFYIDKNGYDTIIEKIKRDISRNSSEFRFLPEKMVSYFDEDILKLEREDTVNKLRAINGVSIDKYELSKTIGKNIMMSGFAEDKKVRSFVKSIEQILQNSELVKNYILWESILNYYVINEKWSEIVGFTKSFLSALEHMDEDSEKDGIEYRYLKTSQVDSVGDSLIKYFHGCFIRSTSIAWGKEIIEVIEKVALYMNSFHTYTKYNALFNATKVIEMRKKCCSARLINHDLLPVAIEECMSSFRPTDNRDNLVKFNELQFYLESEEKARYKKEMRRYAPYISSPFDILYTNLLKLIKHDSSQVMSDIECVELLHRNYARNFNELKSDYLKKYISADNYGYDGDYRVKVVTQNNRKDKGKIRIAVANVRMDEGDIKDILLSKKRNISSRCAEINRIVKEAIRYKSDILIFPESYIPVSYLPKLEKKARNSNMTIIGGLEHIKSGKKVYNYTVVLLPIVQKSMRYTVPFFHLKKFYSPHEVEIIARHGCTAVLGDSHTLFEWKGIRFAPYCCFELTSIEERSVFKKEVDVIFGIEWNPDTDYFSNIMESLSRDLSCYCVQANMSEFGDSRIIQPSKRISMNVARVKGGKNGLVIIDDVDISKLRRHHKNGKEDFKPLPAGWN